MSTSARPVEKVEDIPEKLYDASTKTTYKRLRFFGKGGFAKCYEIINVSNDQIFAGKIVSKKLVMKHNQKDKMTQEIQIHKSLNHENVVKFCSYFDDPFNVYIVLELCKKRSMMELHKRRKTITDYECRFFIYQILRGVKYLHDNHIIHRDLKLGNLFLNDELCVKIGDFGLATKIEYDGERKKTLCGTPNYIAPEILTKKGHSYEVDIWSIGCVMYTLLVGQPPFETKSLKDTYSKIKKCDYRVPSNLRKNAADMIIAMLQSNPEKRPTVNKLLKFEYIINNFIPTTLPASCLTMEPRADQIDQCERYVPNRRPLVEVNGIQQMEEDGRGESFIKHDPITASGAIPKTSEHYRTDVQNLYDQISKLILNKPPRLEKNLGDEYSNPDAHPLFWVSKWVDYSDKYGFGYQLCDEGMGVMFNDTTKLIMLSNGINVHFVDKDGDESYMTIDKFSPHMEKKMKLLTYFKRYMTEHLVKAGANAPVNEDKLSRIPHLHTWFRTQCAVVMHLTNGTIQLNFSDHVKIILCPLMQAITFMDIEKTFRTYRFSTIQQQGCSADLYQKLRYAHEKLKKLLSQL